MAYRDFLGLLHALLRPTLYFEIGVGSGGSIARAACVCVAVDPRLAVTSGALTKKTECHFFQMTSDQFFADEKRCRRALFQPVDFAFLDGLHHYEVLLRDFLQTERYCSPQGIIVLHDCLPYDFEVAERYHRPEARSNVQLSRLWAGDVWKIIPILRRYRPDLQIVSFDCPPTGLVVCANLDPRSEVLGEHYETIVRDYANIELAEFGIDALFESSNLMSSTGASPQQVANLLHLN
jgi:hypothetical protein